MNELAHLLRALVGHDDPARSLSVLQMGVRALLIYLGGLFVVRLGKNRLFGRSTAFDIVLGFILGSTLSRAINGGAPVFETLAAVGGLVVVHWLFAWLAVHSDRFDQVVNGRRVLLVEGGKIHRENLRRADLSEGDLREALRLRASVDGLEGVKEASLERNGQISFVLRSPSPS